MRWDVQLLRLFYSKQGVKGANTGWYLTDEQRSLV